MTSKYHKKMAALFAPKVVYADTRYAIHALDSTEREVREGTPADPWRSIVPTGFPEHSNSLVIQQCLFLIEKGLRGIPLSIAAQLLEGLSPDLAELAHLAGLSERETDVLALTGNGWKQREIAEWLEIDQATVSRRLHSGRDKLATRLPQEVAMRLNRIAQSA